MKLLVIQEQHFTRMPNGEVWTDEQSDVKFWNRYLDVFEELVVCGRFTHASEYDTNKLIRSDRENVSFIELPNFRGVMGLLRNIVNVKSIIRKAIKRCDRIIFRAPSPISLIAYPLAKASGKPFATELINNPQTTFSQGSMHHVCAPLIRRFVVSQTKSLCRDANGVSYVTEHILQELYPSRARLYGETERYFESSYSTIRMDESRYHFEDWPNEMPKTTTLIHTGKMQDRRKGQDVFINTIAKLRDRGYSVNGILVGEGCMRKEFETLGNSLGISEHLTFTGWKAGFEAVQKELLKSHILVLPTIGEGLPRSVIEAMAQGLLCFASEVDGLKELLYGDFLVPEFSAECFAQHIQIYLNDWQKALKERRRLYEISRRYEYSILQARRKEFYRKLRNVPMD